MHWGDWQRLCHITPLNHAGSISDPWVRHEDQSVTRNAPDWPVTLPGKSYNPCKHTMTRRKAAGRFDRIMSQACENHMACGKLVITWRACTKNACMHMHVDINIQSFGGAQEHQLLCGEVVVLVCSGYLYSAPPRAGLCRLAGVKLEMLLARAGWFCCLCIFLVHLGMVQWLSLLRKRLHSGHEWNREMNFPSLR